MSKPNFTFGDVVKVVNFNYMYISKTQLRDFQLSGYYLDCIDADELHENSMIAYPINKDDLNKIGVIESCDIVQDRYKYGLRFEDNSYKAWYDESVLESISRKTINYGHRTM